MAQDSWPHNAHNTRNVTDSEYEKLSAEFGNGIYGDPSGSAVVTAGAGLQVLVKANNGGSLRGHYWTSGTSDVALSITANASGSTRVDRVVLRLDRTDWTVAAVIREGTAGSGAPSLVQQTGDTGVYEILLAEVTVLNGASSVTVTPRTLYVGSRIRAENQGAANPNPALGEISYRHNTGEYVGHVGSGSYVTLYGDSGEQSLSVGYSDRWDAVGPMIGRKHNGWVCAQINLKRKGETFSENDESGSWLATLPTDLRPDVTEYFAGQFTGGASVRIEVRTDGQIWANELSNSVGVGRFFRLTMTWLAPD